MSEPSWVPLGGQPVDYEGAWAAGVQYGPGDVVTYQGVNFLAVNPSLGATPPRAIYGFGAEVAYQEFTVPVALPASGFPGATVVVTAPAFTADGNSDYLVESYLPYLQAGSGGAVYLTLWEDSTDRGIIATVGTGLILGPARAARRLRPAAGSHVYSVRGTCAAAGGSPAAGAGVGGSGLYVPGFIRVTRAA